MANGPTSLDDFTPEQLKALQDIAQARVDDSLSRRDALKALGMVGGGAATGAIGASTLADPAKASASTTDSDGDVGAPNDRVDVYADGVDATSVKADVGYFNDTATSPSTPGEMRLNGTDIEAYTGGGVKNLSNIGSGAPDTIVTTTSELESAFNNLSAGDYVFIKSPSTPYRTTQWLDIDVSNVRIKGESPFASDGQAMIKPADGADVGGFRVGHNTAASNVVINSVGFDGNQSTMTNTVKRLHAVDLESGSHITVRGCYATQTHPYHEHNSGGSGISVTDNVSNALIYNNYIEDIGDRGIQCAGVDCKIVANTAANGFDRSIAHAVQKDDGSVAGGYRIITAYNIGWNNSQGSIIGIGGGGINTPRGRIIVYGNIGYGNANDGFTAFNGQSGGTYEHIHIKGNYFYNNGARGIEIREGAGDPLKNITIQNNVIEDPGGTGIYVNANNVLVEGNMVDTPATGYGLHLGNETTPEMTYVTAVNNAIYQSPNAGVYWVVGEGRVGGNQIIGPAGHGIAASVVDAIMDTNQIRNAGNDGISTTGNDCIILGNRIKGSTNVGIDNTGTGTVVQANITGNPN